MRRIEPVSQVTALKNCVRRILKTFGLVMRKDGDDGQVCGGAEEDPCRVDNESRVGRSESACGTEMRTDTALQDEETAFRSNKEAGQHAGEHRSGPAI